MSKTCKSGADIHSLLDVACMGDHECELHRESSHNGYGLTRKVLAEAAYRRGFQQAVVALGKLFEDRTPLNWQHELLILVADEVAADMRFSQKPQPGYMHKFMETVSKKLS
jgi:hypothetical protein